MQYTEATILVAGDNFGCGSSREHAVWALLQAGIKVIIAKSFADIFSANAFKNGLLLITLSNDHYHHLIVAAKNNQQISINLPCQTISLMNNTISFDIEPFKKHCLINGIDQLDYLLSHLEAIKSFFNKREIVNFVADQYTSIS